jgi:hydrogenase maturation protease
MSGSHRPVVLVVGIGNPDRGDDALGPTVARRLCGRLSAGVSIRELGGDALALIEDWKGFSAAILVDAVAPIAAPGRVQRFDLTNNPLPITIAPPSTHALGLAETVELARSLGRLPPFVVAYLVEAEQFEMGSPLSPASIRPSRRWSNGLSPRSQTGLTMHETALVRDIVRRIDDLARAMGARRIRGAKVWIGALSHLSAEHFRDHFAIEARDTLAAGVVLEIEVSEDRDHPHAPHVRLESVDLDEENAGR